MKKGTRKSSGKSENKSQLVRDYATQNPQAKISEIVKHFADKGVAISSPLAHQALKGTASKSGAKAKKRGRPAGAKKAAPARTSSGENSLVASALAFVKQAGSLDSAIETLSLLKQFE